MGGTYSPNAGADLSDTYPGYGWLIADATVAPDQARVIADAIKAVAAALHDKGVTEEELVRAKQPILTQLRESARTNSLLARQRARRRPGISRTARLEPVALQHDNESVTAAELSALAKQYLDPAKASEFIVVPAATPAK
ncbi:MAG: hypothetical protein WDM96_15915 [Lacunisphaera sp.]